MDKFNVVVRTAGSNTQGVWIVPKSLPLEVGIKLAGIADLSDFASIVKADGSAVTAAPAVGSVVACVGINLRRFHRSEGEGKERVYSPTPSFALELIVA